METVKRNLTYLTTSNFQSAIIHIKCDLINLS